MPELPDLQVFSRNLNKRLKGKTVKHIAMPGAKRSNVSEAALKKRLSGQCIEKIFREGKELRIAFSKGDVLGLHLMLNGDMHVFEGKNEYKHTVMEIGFKDGSGLALTDWQRMATPTLNPKPHEAPDALSPKVNYKFLKDRLQTRTAIKTVLLDQKIIRGIGNAYADEILWTARISPFSSSSKIPDVKIKKLAKAIRTVLRNAEKQIMKKSPNIISGEVRDFLAIHNAKKKKSPTGANIQHKSAGGRKTYFTKEQELFK